jgi:endonuclease YncB( thermonuclease family)
MRWMLMALLVILAGCTLELEDGGSADIPTTPIYTSIPAGEQATVTRIIDGDTIDVEIDGQEFRVRYVGVNTPERDEPCYNTATDANADMIAGERVVLVRDQTNTDRYDRILRYIYREADGLFVNAELVRRGYAEAALYEPDDRHFDVFSDLEDEADRAGRGCHPTGIFDDGNPER